MLILSICSISVMASLYTDKIPDPGRFQSIEPIWSASLQKASGDQITASLIRFEWLDNSGRTSKVEMFYLHDGSDRYIADGGSYTYSMTHQFSCDSGYDNCISGCSNDESCIDDCTRDFNCGTQSTCEITGPDGTCGFDSATTFFGNNKLLLNFDPGTGELLDAGTSYNGEQLTVSQQSGALTQGVFQAE